MVLLTCALQINLLEYQICWEISRVFLESRNSFGQGTNGLQHSLISLFSLPTESLPAWLAQLTPISYDPQTAAYLSSCFHHSSSQCCRIDSLNPINVLETASAKISSVTLFSFQPSQVSSPKNLQRVRK